MAVDGAHVISWRIGRAGDGVLPPLDVADAWLAPGERERARRLATPKRRRDWLTGRLNLKVLVGDVVEARYGVRPAPPAVIVEPDASGAPVVRLAVVSPLAAVAPLALANSHSDGYAAGAALWLDGLRAVGRDGAVGIDLERIAPRAPGLVRDFLTAPEAHYCREGETSTHDARVTQVWSAKEAVLKVLGHGLRADTRWVSCVPGDPRADVPESPFVFVLQPSAAQWAPVSVTCDGRLGAEAAHLAAWSRVWEGFALCVAVGAWAAEGGEAGG